MLLLIVFGLWAGFVQAQIGNTGINTDTPAATLEVKRLTDLTNHYPGIIAPRITGNQLNGKPYQDVQDGAFVFVTEAADVAHQTKQTVNVKCRGYYYYDKVFDEWMPFVPCKCKVKVSATKWKEFMCHNLGANQNLDPHDMNQPNAWGLNGSYIQWGKHHDMWAAANDGPAGFAAAPTASNANPDNITGWDTSPFADDNAWNNGTDFAPIKTANDPCPMGYRIPTRTEWQGVIANNEISRSGNWVISNTNYGSAIHFGPQSSLAKLLTLPAAGKRGRNTGKLFNRDSGGCYWSSAPNSSTHSFRLQFLSNSQVVDAEHRRHGYSIRCIAE